MGKSIAARLTTQLIVLVLVALTMVFGAEAWLRLRQNLATFRADMERDHCSIARVLRLSVERTPDGGNEDELLELLQDVGVDASRLQLTWVALDPTIEGASKPSSPAEVLGRVEVGQPSHWVWEPENGERWLITTVATRSSGSRGPWIEVAENLASQSAFARAALGRTFITLVICLLISGGTVAWLGSRLVRLGVGELEATATASSQRAGEAEAQLRHADRLGTVGFLAASVAHELGSPLNVIRIYGQGLSAAELGDHHDLIDAGKQIVCQCDRMISLLGRLMRVARARIGEPAPVDLVGVVGDTLALTRTLTQKSGVQLQCCEMPDSCMVMGVRAELQQVLLNLLVNGIQAMPDGGELRLSLKCVDGDDRPVAQVEVSDSGAGIEPEVLGKVFGAFYTTKPEGQGTGLGLTVCAAIVGEHGGQIKVTSEPGQGAAFTVQLPIIVPNAASETSCSGVGPRHA